MTLKLKNNTGTMAGMPANNRIRSGDNSSVHSYESYTNYEADSSDEEL
jgi:hypothetical protein